MHEHAPEPAAQAEQPAEASALQPAVVRTGQQREQALVGIASKLIPVGSPCRPGPVASAAGPAGFRTRAGPHTPAGRGAPRGLLPRELAAGIPLPEGQNKLAQLVVPRETRAETVQFRISSAEASTELLAASAERESEQVARRRALVPEAESGLPAARAQPPGMAGWMGGTGVRPWFLRLCFQAVGPPRDEHVARHRPLRPRC